MHQRESAGLKDLALKFLGRTLDKRLALSNWSRNLSQAHIKYAALDAIATKIQEFSSVHRISQGKDLALDTAVRLFPRSSRVVAAYERIGP
jgi:ribonuclease D